MKAKSSKFHQKTKTLTCDYVTCVRERVCTSLSTVFVDKRLRLLGFTVRRARARYVRNPQTALEFLCLAEFMVAG
jgi:hypothetical protein